MRIMTAALVLALAGNVQAQEHSRYHSDHEVVFGSASQLLSWCEQEARAYYAGQGVTTYQWTGRHFESGNTLHAEGKLRANGLDVPVTCLAARGARERHAVIKFGQGQ
jgi:hypothetical protein